MLIQSSWKIGHEHWEWRHYKVRGLFSISIHPNAREMSHLAQGRAFNSQAQTQAPTYLLLPSHSQRAYKVRPFILWVNPRWTSPLSDGTGFKRWSACDAHTSQREASRDWIRLQNLRFWNGIQRNQNVTKPYSPEHTAKHGIAPRNCFTIEWVWLPDRQKLLALLPGPHPGFHHLQYIGEPGNEAKKLFLWLLVNGISITKLFSNNLALYSSNYMSIQALLHSISLTDMMKLGEGKYGVRETKGEEQS